MAPKKKKKKEPAKEAEPAKKSLAALDLPPQRILEEEAVEEILERLPKIILDHNIYHKTFEETFEKEDRAIHRLSELQKESIKSDPKTYRASTYNPYNPQNHQFVLGKVLTRDSGPELPNEQFLNDTLRIKTKPTEKQVLPETSAQVIGWFTKSQPLCTFRPDTRVNHPRRYSELSQYMDTFWSYYPPPPAKFHPKDK